MKKILLSVLFTFTMLAFVSAQNGNLSGYVKDAISGNALSGAQVSLGDLPAQATDANGQFSFKNVAVGNYLLIVNQQGYKSARLAVEISEGDNKMTDVLLKVNDSDETDAVVTLSEMDFDEEAGNDNVSSILYGSRDAFSSVAAYTFGPMRFRVRGYDGKYSKITMNNLPMNDVESGRGGWYNWGGLNDAVRNSVRLQGLNASDYMFGDIGGTTNISTRASNYRVGNKVTYSLSNRSYSNRLMFHTATGLMDNGLAIVASGSRRWSEEGYVEGTFYDAWAYFLAAEKKINENHSVNLTAFGSPSRRGAQGASTQEVYDLVKNNYYNPYWGYQNGEVRNSRVSDSHRPYGILTHYWKLNNASKLTSSVAFVKGTYGRTALNWKNVADPRPDYYRELPSYATNDYSRDLITSMWTSNNTDITQINWNDIYQRNYGVAISTVEGVGGTTESVTGQSANYIIERRADDIQQLTANTVYVNELNENSTLRGGAGYIWYVGSHYTEVADLLGADYWLDIDKFAERDFVDPAIAQSDIRYPNSVAYEGDVFGYDYDAHVNTVDAWAQNEFKYNKIDAFVSLQVSNTTMWRTGNMQNGKFPDNSLGDSEKKSFLNYGAKAGADWKISGRHYVTARAAYMTKAPNFRNAFVSVRTRDQYVDGLESEQILSGDVGYILRAPNMKASVTAYYTQINNSLNSMSFYHDGYQNFVNYIMKDIDYQHLGVEFGLEANITPTLVATTAVAYGQHTWNSQPKVSAFIDNSSEQLVKDEIVYAKNFKISGTPQTAASIGLKYNSPKYWFVGVNANYIDDIYLSFNPVRRTEESVYNVDPGSDAWHSILDQEKEPSAYTLDAFLGKSFRFNGYYLAVNLNVSNILDYKELITGGYEQLRFDETNVDKFPPKYYYYYGRTFFLNVNFSF